MGGSGDGIMVANEDERISLRAKYGIHPSAFVYCYHSRPDKIDPSTFRSEDNEANHTAVAPVLWLLRSGEEMEQNLRQWVRQEFGEMAEDCLVFADVAERAAVHARCVDE